MKLLVDFLLNPNFFHLSFDINFQWFSGSEDGTVRVWHANTHRLESSLNYGFERVWTICCLKGSNNVALGYDEGSILVKVGREEPAASMDASGGKIIWARHSELQQANLKALPEGKLWNAVICQHYDHLICIIR